MIEIASERIATGEKWDYVEGVLKMKDKSDYLKVFGIETYWVKAVERFREWTVEDRLSLK